MHTVEPPDKGHLGTRHVWGFKMYCENMKFFIKPVLDNYGGYSYCVLYTECLLREVPLCLAILYYL